MTGQDAVNVADTFNKDLGITGLIITKLDGDASGGAVLSVKEVTGCSVKYAGMGEKLDALEPFYPDRMASRILGMGDILSLIDKIKDTTDLAKALEMEKKLSKDEFTLEQFLEQMQQVKKMGSLETILGLIPGMGNISQKLKDANVDEREFDRVEAIIKSMTPKERRHPDLINGSRRKRIAAGSRHAGAGCEQAPEKLRGQQKDDEEDAGYEQVCFKRWSQASFYALINFVF
jgi:signal recognition particle subunit SRP54